MIKIISQAFLFSLLLSGSTALSAPPQGINLNTLLHAWFENQYNVNGGWCCNLSDGHILENYEWRTTEKGMYQVLIENNWYDITPSHYLKPTGGPNPTGKAIVWYMHTGAGIQIYCFTPGFLS